MNFNHSIAAILRGYWAIDVRTAEAYGPFIASLLAGEVPELPEATEKKSAIVSHLISDEGKRYYDFDEAPKGSIAVVSVQGALMKNDQREMCRATVAGMNTISNLVKAADSHKNVDAIVLHIDSPGGTVDGTKNFADAIKNTNKPVVAYVDGMMCSAAMWIGSSASEIIASNDLDEIGSIGVMISFADMKPVYEKMGVKFHYITADTSPDKNKNILDAIEGKYDAIKKDSLNPIDQVFMDVIKTNRPNVKDDQLTGKVYFAKDVVGTLIDAIGDFDYALRRAKELSHSKTKVYV